MRERKTGRGSENERESRRQRERGKGDIGREKEKKTQGAKEIFNSLHQIWVRNLSHRSE